MMIEVGQKYGRLTVIELLQDGLSDERIWTCKCECGNFTNAKEKYLKNGHKKSCGCLYGEASKIHGMTKSRLFNIWSGMHERCEREKHPHFKDYGGRGISVCDEWKEFISFRDWALKNGYNDLLTIDRENPDGNYESSNCRWVTIKVQQNNRRNNHIIEHDGESHTISEWSEITGIKKTTIKERIKMGWSIKDVLTKPVRERTRGYRPSAKMDGKAV